MRLVGILRILPLVLLALAATPAAADDYVREDLRIPLGSGRSLEALLVKPPGTQRYPLALISHGTPRDENARSGMTPNRLYPQALEFARRGFAALIVMRRGYGRSDGFYAENSGACGRREYMLAARASASDLRAAFDAMESRTDVTSQGSIAVGVSAGGFASVALSADPPPGLAAVISFAGGRGSRADNDVCDEDNLVRAFGTLGKTSRVPELWIYASNDKFFGPDLAHRMHNAFTAAGGRAQFIDAPAFGEDGHFLFSQAGQSVWTPMVDRFLRDQTLGTRNLAAAPAAAALPPPSQLGDKGRAGFAAYLAAAPHKAFAVAPKGAFAYRSGQRTAAEAREATLSACAEYASDCRLYAEDDQLAGPSASGFVPLPR